MDKQGIFHAKQTSMRKFLKVRGQPVHSSTLTITSFVSYIIILSKVSGIYV